MSAYTNDTNNTLGREAARLLALWFAEREEVRFAQPGDEVPVVVAGYQYFGSGGYSASGRVVGPHTVVRGERPSNGFVTTTISVVRGEHGAVAESRQSDCLGGFGNGGCGSRQWGRRVAWLAGLPAEPERRPEYNAADVLWRAYHHAMGSRERFIMAFPAVIDVLWRASSPDTSRALDARLAARAAVGEDAHDALVGQPAALRILSGMRRAAAHDLAHKPGAYRAPFDSTARAVMSARAVLAADADLGAVCAAVEAAMAAEEAHVAGLLAEEEARRRAEARFAAEEASRRAR